MTALFESRALAEVASDKLKIFAQPQRLMILSLLGKGEYSVGEIDAATGIGQPALSQQLAELRRAELVRTRKQAKAVYYRLADADAALCVRALEAIMGGAGDPAQQLAAALSPAAAPALPALGAPPGSAAFARVG
jgi:DNA-binding transcriptional ArsR family regulator